nr:hypothetical protein 11 [Desulfobacterales bacterium]
MQPNNPRVACVFNPSGFEGYYVLSRTDEEQRVAIQMINQLYHCLVALGERTASSLESGNDTRDQKERMKSGEDDEHTRKGVI